VGWGAPTPPNATLGASRPDTATTRTPPTTPTTRLPEPRGGSRSVDPGQTHRRPPWGGRATRPRARSYPPPRRSKQQAGLPRTRDLPARDRQGPGKVRFLARWGEVAGAKTAFGSGFTVMNGSFRTSEVLNDPFMTLAVRAGCDSSGHLGGNRLAEPATLPVPWPGSGRARSTANWPPPMATPWS
jgi:hypothetical protein